jgi:hypothetical protein
MHHTSSWNTSTISYAFIFRCLQNCERWPLALSCLSVPMEQPCSPHEIWYLSILQKIVRKFKFHYNWKRIASILHEDQYKFLIISCSVLLRMRNFWDQICRGNQNTHFVFINPPPTEKSFRLWDNVWEKGRAGQVTDDNMAHARCVLDT